MISQMIEVFCIARWNFEYCHVDEISYILSIIHKVLKNVRMVEDIHTNS